MIEVILENRNAKEILELVQGLRLSGVQQEKDFNFKYRPGGYDGGGTWIPSLTSFYFYTEKYATMFKLRYI